MTINANGFGPALLIRQSSDIHWPHPKVCNKYRHSSIYAVNVGTHKETQKQKLRKSRLLSSTEGEANMIEL